MISLDNPTYHLESYSEFEHCALHTPSRGGGGKQGIIHPRDGEHISYRDHTLARVPHQVSLGTCKQQLCGGQLSRAQLILQLRYLYAIELTVIKSRLQVKHRQASRALRHK